MSLDAGSVFTRLGFKLDSAGAKEYDAQVKKAIATGEAAEARLAAASGRVAAAHDRVASAASRVAQSNRRLSESIPLRAMDQWSKNSSQAEKNLAKLGRTATTGAALGLLGIGTAAIYATAKAVSFNREMLKVATQAGGTRDEVKGLSREVLALAGTVPQGPNELAQGLYHIASAGFRGAKALEILKTSAQAAAIGQASLEETSNAVIGAMVSQIKGAENAASATGMLNATVGIGNMRFDELDKAIGTQILPTFAEAGLTMTDFGASLATVTDNSVPANVTATRLRMTISQMVSPTKAAAKELASIGLTNKSLANDLRQPNGLLVAIEDLKNHLRDSGKTAVEQDAILSNSFGRGKSSAVIMTLVAELGRLRQKYDELGKTDGPAKLAKSWSEFQHSEAATFGELKSGAEAFAITVGDVLMPTLGKLGQGLHNALSQFVASGGADKVAAGMQGAFSVIGSAVSTLAPDVETVAVALYHLAAAGVSVGQALGLGLGGQIATLAAGFLAFRAVEFVSPILLSVAGGISEIGVAAATAGSLSAFAGDLLAMSNPVTALAGVLGIAAGAFVAFKSGLFSSSSAASENAAAVKADKEAISQLNDAVNQTANAEIEAKQASLDRKAALEHLHEVEDRRKKGKATQLEEEQARLQFERADLRQMETQETALKKLQTQQQKAEKTRETAGKRSGELGEKMEEERSLLEYMRRNGDAKHTLETQTKSLAKTEREYAAASRQTAQAMAEIAVTEISRNRQSHGLAAITPGNARGVNQLQIALSGLPGKVVTKYELTGDQNVLSRLGSITTVLEQIGKGTTAVKILTNAPSASAAIVAMKAVLAGVPANKILHILHNAPSAKAAMEQLTGAIHAVPGSKGVAINTNASQVRGEIASVQAQIDSLSGKNIAIAINKSFTAVENVVRHVSGHASGRGAGERETSLVGEGRGPEYVVNSATGRGVKVDRPTLMGLGPDDYVIPLEDQYRGRALGLFAMLARDLGIPGYKKGKAKGKGHGHHTIPNAIDPLSLPLGDIEQKQQAAHSAYEHAAAKVKSLEGQVKKAQGDLRFAKGATTRAKDVAKLTGLRRELADARRSKGYTTEHKKELEWQRTLREAKQYQAKIDHETAVANIAANEMRQADNRGDDSAFNAAKSKRDAALKALAGLISNARKHVKTDPHYFDELSEKLGSAELEGEATEGEQFKSSNPADEREEQTGMTDAEAARLKDIEKNVALAALTPSLEDDKTAAQELVSFFEGVLGEAMAEPAVRGGDSAITSLADSLKTARSNLESFSGRGTNENADLQAQLNQREEQLAVERRRAQINEQALEVFGGSGDIGAGGANAAQAAAGITQNIYTLHPGDPATLRAIGDAAVSGIGYQGSRRSPRIQVGP